MLFHYPWRGCPVINNIALVYFFSHFFLHFFHEPHCPHTRLLMASKACPVFSCPVLFTLVPPLAPPPFPSLWRTPAYSFRLSVVSFSGDTSHGSSWQVFGCFLPYFLLQHFCCCLMRAYFLLRPDFGLS